MIPVDPGDAVDLTGSGDAGRAGAGTPAPVGRAGAVLVVGSGLAGLTCALDLVAAGTDVVLATKGPLGGGSTAWAQGGIAAVVPDPGPGDPGPGDPGADDPRPGGPAAGGPAGAVDGVAPPPGPRDGHGRPADGGDTVAQHVADTLAAGAGASRADVAALVCAGGAAAITAMVARGVAFDRDGARWARGLEAAHGHHRVLHADGDGTGAAISRALVAAARAAAEQRHDGPGGRLEILEHAALVDLVVVGGVVVGADLLVGADPPVDAQDPPDPPGPPGPPGPHGGTVPRRLGAGAVVLATGGAGQVYERTTNPGGATGDGLAAAWRAGAVVADPEMVQFHPTAAAVEHGAPFLVSEAVRGEGAVLRDEQGRRYLLEGSLAHPLGELAPRDVVARATTAVMAAQDGRPVLLDVAPAVAALGGRLDARFPGIDALCRAAGVDWARTGVPVTPAAHYWMGGVLTDGSGRTTLPGLWAVGEVACTGLHGANRLASNSLLEAAVLAARAAADVERALVTGERPTAAVDDEVADGLREVVGEAVTLERDELQRLMWAHAGLLRDAPGLELAAKTLQGPPDRPGRADGPDRAGGADGADRGGDTGAGAGADADPLRALEDANLATVARLVVLGALARTESRGAHHRTDHPTTAPRARTTVLRRSR